MEYQTEKMVAGIMDIVSAQTHDVVKSLVASMGGDWQTFLPRHLFKAPNDTQHGMIAGIVTKINDRLIVRIVINPAVIDKQLVI
ncbi:hypothetical protein, partial [Arcticibacter svalbardensis]|uniref:hypothetical protein n=1 Tax=Arcticibacter svalbardensis TaxID=1288027 RepID=UPI001F194FE2